MKKVWVDILSHNMSRVKIVCDFMPNLARFPPEKLYAERFGEKTWQNYVHRVLKNEADTNFQEDYVKKNMQNIICIQLLWITA